MVIEPAAYRDRGAAAVHSNLSGWLQFLLDIERELNHAFHQLFSWQSSEIFEHQFLDIEAHQISQLEGAVARGEDKIAMPVIDNDQIPLGIKSRAP
jgi:hypothetical protein